MLLVGLVLVLALLHNSAALSCYEGASASNDTIDLMKQDGYTLVNENMTEIECNNGTKYCISIRRGKEWIAQCDIPHRTNFLATGAKCNLQKEPSKCLKLDTMMGKNSELCCCSGNLCNAGSAHFLSSVAIVPLIYRLITQ